MTGRGFLNWKIHDAIQRLGAAASVESKLHWARVLNEAKRERGDFENTKPPREAEHTKPIEP